jgi:hypothetical protein
MPGVRLEIQYNESRGTELIDSRNLYKTNLSYRLIQNYFIFLLTNKSIHFNLSDR